MGVLKLGTKGYIVGYDGQVPGGDVPKGKWVFARDGMSATPIIHSTYKEALDELGDQETVAAVGLTGVKRYTLAVHHIKVRWLPIVEGHRGYAKTFEVISQDVAQDIAA